MMDVTVNVWKLGSDGGKYASTMTLTVHKYLAADVYDIFQQIFNDPEQFPINSAGAPGSPTPCATPGERPST